MFQVHPWSIFRRIGARALLGVAVSSFALSAQAKNLLVDGTGFETGVDGWEIMPYRFMQDPEDPATSYPDGWDMVSANPDTVREGNFALALRGSSGTMRHEVRWASLELDANSDYVFTVWAKVVSDALGTRNCPKSGLHGTLRVSNGERDAIPPHAMRISADNVKTCWQPLVFLFNTADIIPGREHPDDEYALRMIFDASSLDWAEQGDYTVYLDAAQLEKASTPTDYVAAVKKDIGVDVVPAGPGATVAERALRYYKLFEWNEDIEIQYYVRTEEGQARPRQIGAQVFDGYLKDSNGDPLLLLDQIRGSDPGNGGIATISIDPADLVGGSGSYEIVVGSTDLRVSESVFVGVLARAGGFAPSDLGLNQFGVMVNNYRYSHRSTNKDGHPGNDRPECEGAEPGDGACTSDVLFLAGPDPELTFWLLSRMDVPHVRVKHVFEPSGFAPHDQIDGTWRLTQARWFAELAAKWDIKILAILGDDIEVIERPEEDTVWGYPSYMSPEAIPGAAGWEAFLAGNQRCWQELAGELGGLIYAYEIFNEPTSVRNSLPLANLGELAQLANQTFGALDPDALVVGYGLTGMSPRGLSHSDEYPQGRDVLFKEFIQMGALNTMDVGALRIGATSEVAAYVDSAYNEGLAMRLAYCGRSLKAEVDRLIRAYDPANVGKSFWITETNFVSESMYSRFDYVNSRDHGLLGRRVDPQRAVARMIQQQFHSIVAAGFERGYYFNFDNSQFCGIHNPAFRSLFDVYKSPRSSLIAFYTVAQQLAGAEFLSQVNPGRQRVYMKFSRGRYDLVVVYLLDPGARTFKFTTGKPTRNYDMWANQVSRPTLGVEPVYIWGRGLHMDSVIENIERQVALVDAGYDPVEVADAFENGYDAVKFAALSPPSEEDGDEAGPNLRFKSLPSFSSTYWDFECPAQTWLGFNAPDMTDRVIKYANRFGEISDFGIVVSGEYTVGYQDDADGRQTGIHSDATVMLGAELFREYRYLKQQLLAPYGLTEAYVNIRDRDNTNVGTYLIATNDDSVTQDPRYRLEDFRRNWADMREKRANVPVHTVDLVELFNENGYLLNGSTEYLLDIIVFATNNRAELGIDNVEFSATP